MCMLVPRIVAVPAARSTSMSRSSTTVVQNKPVLADARVEVGDLCAPRTGVVDVYSDEAERRHPARGRRARGNTPFMNRMSLNGERQRFASPPSCGLVAARTCPTDVPRARWLPGSCRPWRDPKSAPSEEGGAGACTKPRGKNSSVVGIGSTSPMPGPPARALPGRSNPALAAAPIGRRTQPRYRRQTLRRVHRWVCEWPSLTRGASRPRWNLRTT